MMLQRSAPEKLCITCNGQSRPLVVELSYGPYFSWRYESGFANGFFQSAYRIVVSGKEGILWDSGRVSSGKQHMIVYGGKPLSTLSAYAVGLTVWDLSGAKEIYGEFFFETGASGHELAQGRWIGGKTALRKEIALCADVKQARAFVTCVGYYELQINGGRASDQALTPSHTDFEKRVEYQAYDITEFLKKGNNAVGLLLGHGMPQNDPFDVKEPYAVCMLHIELKNGEIIKIFSDESWQALDSAIVSNSLFSGERYDARLEQDGWSCAGFDGETIPVRVFPAPMGRLVPQILPPILRICEIRPKAVQKLQNGDYLLDYGQNLSGVVRVSVQGERGREIILRHAELLNEDGTVNQKNLRILDLQDSYILKGEGREVHEPRFTYHGFRYVQVTGYPGELSAEDAVAVVIRSAVSDTGHFTCSDDLYNEIHSAMRWTLANNLHSIPTDCPQRNERRGWMADGHVASEANICNYDMHWFYRKWMQDILDIVDEETGKVKHAMAPRWLEKCFFPWSAALFILPWNIYRYYDDVELVREVYPTLRKTLSYFSLYADENSLITDSRDLDDAIAWDTTYDDWLAIDRTRNVQVINGFLYHENKIMSEFAGLLDLADERASYEKTAEKIKNAYNAVFLSPDPNIPVKNGIYGSAYDVSQYAQALPLSLGMTPEEDRQKVLDNLLWDVLYARGSAQLTTGVLGTRCLIDLLAQAGRNDVVSALFTRMDFPGWGFMLKCGATTIWERWQRMQGADMNSHDHPALAAPDTWFYRHLAGMGEGRTDQEGRRVFRTKPYISERLTYAEATCGTPWGSVSAGWEKKDGGVALTVFIPPNTSADVVFNGETHHVLSGGHRFDFRI